MASLSPSWRDLTSLAVTETHCAVVVFVGDRAYKLKKAVDLGFLDFTTVEARARACHREVELNRRLADDVYLGVADVTGPDGRVCDHLVVMRRMPADRRLATRLAAGHPCDDDLRMVARRLAVLHANVPSSRDDPRIGEVATRDAVATNWEDNLAALQGVVGDIIEGDEYARVASLARRYLAGRGPLFEDRIAAGQVRDGHGDLLAEDIFCLDDGPRILDCLEFDDRYRYGDVLLDATFLAMDLERLGHPAAAERFLHWYLEFSGEHHPATLAHHYTAYRAHVRAKVAALRHAQGDPRAGDDVRLLHRMSLDHLRRGRVALVLVGGLPGAGKSTVASGLSEAHGWALLRSDEIRKDLAGLGHAVDAHAAVGDGLYRPDAVSGTYDEMHRRAERLLARGVSVVLDASWTSRVHREAASGVADRTASDLVQLDCVTTPDVARARLAARPPGRDASDATIEVLEALAARADPWPQAARIRTGHPIDRVLAQAEQEIRTQLDRAEGTGAADQVAGRAP